MDNNTVKVVYVKLENNVADILTKNLQPRLFEKHASKLVTNIRNASESVNDIGFFLRCNTRQIEKVEIKNATKIPFLTREERLELLAEPMGEIQSYYWNDYIITKWHPNCARLWRLRKRVKGSVQRYSWNIKDN